MRRRPVAAVSVKSRPCMEPPLLASILPGITAVALGYLSPLSSIVFDGMPVDDDTAIDTAAGQLPLWGCQARRWCFGRPEELRWETTCSFEAQKSDCVWSRPPPSGSRTIAGWFQSRRWFHRLRPAL